MSFTFENALKSLSKSTLIICLCVFGVMFTISAQAQEQVKTKSLKYRFYPIKNACFAQNTKEFKKLSKNRIYKNLEDCSKKVKKTNGKVLGVTEKKDGGASTNVSLMIKEK